MHSIHTPSPWRLGTLALGLSATLLIVGSGSSRAEDYQTGSSIASSEFDRLESVDRSSLSLDIAQADYASEMLRLINQERQQQGLEPLALAASLSTAAQDHADEMAQHNFFSHTGRNGSSIGDRAEDAGYNFRRVGENIAAGNTTPSAVFSQWMNSDGHRRNMLNPDFTEMGLGYVLDAPGTTYSHYWVLVLGDR